MIHTSVYKYTPGATAAFLLQDMPAISDPAITVLNGHPIFPSPVQLALAYAWGQVDISAVSFTTPKLRAINVPSIRPFDAATAPTTRPPIFNLSKSPLHLNPIDENAFQISATTGTSGNNYFAAAWFSDGNMNAPQGDVLSVPFTAAVVTTVGVWGNGVITLSQALPAGLYACIGMDLFGANLAIGRLIFPNQVWRPGIIAGVVAGFFSAPCFRLGGLGTMGIFNSFAQPSLEVMGGGTTTTQTGVLDLVKVG